MFLDDLESLGMAQPAGGAKQAPENGSDICAAGHVLPDMPTGL